MSHSVRHDRLAALLTMHGMTASGQHVRSSDEQDQPGLARSVWSAYRLTLRYYPAMLVPAVVALVPLGIVRTVSETALRGQHAVIVNSGYEVSGRPGLAYLVWTVVLLAVTVLALAFTIAAIAIMAAGRLLERPVSPLAAMRAALRRLPVLAALLLFGLVAAAVIVAAGAAVARLGASLPMVVAVWVVLSLVALPYVTAIPAAVLEGQGVWRSLGRAHWVADGRRLRASMALLIGAVMVPALVGIAAELAVRPLAGLSHTLVDQVLQDGWQVAGIPFVAGTVAAVFLARGKESDELRARYLTGGSNGPVDSGRRRYLTVADRGLIRERFDQLDAHNGPRTLPTTGHRRRVRTVGLVATLALPGLLHASYVWSNPLSIPEFTDYQVATTTRSAALPPRLHYGAGHRPIAIYDAAMFACADAECTDATRATVDLLIAKDHVRSGVGWLADGQLAVATWTREEVAGTEETWLRLYGCRATGCPPAGSGSAPVLSQISSTQDWGLAAAVAVAPDGAIVVAHIDVDRDTDESFLYLTTCADHRCAEPRTVRLPGSDDDSDGQGNRELFFGVVNQAAQPLAVAVGPNGEPVVAFLSDRGSVTVVACDNRQCQHPTATKPVRPVVTGLLAGNHHDPWPGVDLVVRPDGVPVVAYRDSATGAAHLLVCRSADCATADNLTLTEPGIHHPPPAIGLSHNGQPMIATYELAHDRLVLISCLDERCADQIAVPLANLEHGPGHLDLGLTADGRPQILRVDTSADTFRRGPSSLRLTTCVAVDCR
jgi:hypothetical protein